MARVLVLDSGGLSRLAERSHRSQALIQLYRERGLWPPLVPTVVLVESLTGDERRDAGHNRFLKLCIVADMLPAGLAGRAAALRFHARRGSPVDAIVVALAEPHGAVLTGGVADVSTLAAYAESVKVYQA